MTEQQFLALIPRDRDALIHSKVMGIDLTGFEWPKDGPGKSMVKRSGKHGEFVTWEDIPYYTTDWGAAGQLMEQEKAQDRYVCFGAYADILPPWEAVFADKAGHALTEWVGGESGPFAIGLTALKARRFIT